MIDGRRVIQSSAFSVSLSAGLAAQASRGLGEVPPTSAGGKCMKTAVCHTFALLASFISALIPLRVLPAFPPPECGYQIRRTGRGRENVRGDPPPEAQKQACFPACISAAVFPRGKCWRPRRIRRTRRAAAKIPENCYKMRKFLPEIFYMIPEIFYIHHRRFSTR